MITAFSTACNSFTSEWVPIEKIGVHPDGTVFIGMQSCNQCHLDIFNSHKQTAHWLTSSKITPATVIPFLNSDKNYFDLKDQTRLSFSIKNDTLFQEAYRRPYKSPFFTKSIDINIGSGTKIGNSFLSWEENSLFQLQGSYYKPKSKWINSPGYPSFFQPKRPIFPRCLECHTTFSQSENWQRAIPTNRYNKENIVFGIDCQKCHGPFVDHVKHHRKNPIDSVVRKILSYKSFSQQQRIDMCALCHSGVGKNINQAAFSFTPGDVLKNYLATQTNNEPDVHSNQVGLLEMSQCFIKSEGMDCMTCHDPHSNERNNVIKFNSRCIECHPSQQHTSLLPENTWDCVKCHMPMKASKIMKIEINPDSISQVLVRTHKIAIYKE